MLATFAKRLFKFNEFVGEIVALAPFVKNGLLKMVCWRMN